MPDNRVSTGALLKRLFKTVSIARFIKYFDKHMVYTTFDTYITDLCVEKNIKPQRVIIKADIERTYGYQLFNGRRKPSRDKVIQLAFGFGMNYDKAQELLKAARKSTLYPKIKRDAVIIYGLEHGHGVSGVHGCCRRRGLPCVCGGVGCRQIYGFIQFFA